MTCGSNSATRSVESGSICVARAEAIHGAKEAIINDNWAAQNEALPHSCFYFGLFRLNLNGRHRRESVGTVAPILQEFPQLRELRGNASAESLDLYERFKALSQTAELLARTLR